MKNIWHLFFKQLQIFHLFFSQENFVILIKRSNTRKKRIRYPIEQRKLEQLSYYSIDDFSPSSFFPLFLGYRHQKEKISSKQNYLITPTLPSLKESCRTFILASCLSAFETDISKSDITFVLCIRKN